MAKTIELKEYTNAGGTYVHCNEYADTGTHKHEDVLSVQAIFFDIDGKKPEEAQNLQLLDQFLITYPFKASLEVSNSGLGKHLALYLSEPTDLHNAQEIAKQLHILALPFSDTQHLPSPHNIRVSGKGWEHLDGALINPTLDINTTLDLVKVGKRRQTTFITATRFLEQGKEPEALFDLTSNDYGETKEVIRQAREKFDKELGEALSKQQQATPKAQSIIPYLRGTMLERITNIMAQHTLANPLSDNLTAVLAMLWLGTRLSEPTETIDDVEMLKSKRLNELARLTIKSSSHSRMLLPNFLTLIVAPSSTGKSSHPIVQNLRDSGNLLRSKSPEGLFEGLGAFINKRDKLLKTTVRARAKRNYKSAGVYFVDEYAYFKLYGLKSEQATLTALLECNTNYNHLPELKIEQADGADRELPYFCLSSLIFCQNELFHNAITSMDVTSGLLGRQILIKEPTRKLQEISEYDAQKISEKLNSLCRTIELVPSTIIEVSDRRRKQFIPHSESYSQYEGVKGKYFGEYFCKVLGLLCIKADGTVHQPTDYEYSNAGKIMTNLFEEFKKVVCGKVKDEPVKLHTLTTTENVFATRILAYAKKMGGTFTWGLYVSQMKINEHNMWNYENAREELVEEGKLVRETSHKGLKYKLIEEDKYETAIQHNNSNVDVNSDNANVATVEVVTGREQQSEPISHKFVILDLEVTPTDYLIGVKIKGNYIQYAHSTHSFEQIEKLIKLIQSAKLISAYNGLHYDLPLLDFIGRNIDDPKAIYQTSSNLVKSEDNWFNFNYNCFDPTIHRKYQMATPMVKADGGKRRLPISLKYFTIQFFGESDHVIDFDTVSIAELLPYNRTDLDTLEKIINEEADMIEGYLAKDIPLWKTFSTICAETYGDYEWKERIHETIDVDLSKYKLPPKVREYFEQFNGLTSQEASEIPALKTFIAQTPHTLKIGGVHSSNKDKYNEKSDDEWLVLIADVASLYPALMILHKLLPPAAMKQYIEDRDNRLVLKKNKDPRATIEKLKLNTVSGCLGFEPKLDGTKKKSLYAPARRDKMCIIGQCLLISFVELLNEKLTSFTLFQNNTDGIIFKIKRTEYDRTMAIIHKFEEVFGVQFEVDEVKRLVQKNVNAYWLELMNGETKVKGSMLTSVRQYSVAEIKERQARIKGETISNIPMKDYAMTWQPSAKRPKCFVGKTLFTRPFRYWRTIEGSFGTIIGLTDDKRWTLGRISLEEPKDFNELDYDRYNFSFFN